MGRRLWLARFPIETLVKARPLLSSPPKTSRPCAFLIVIKIIFYLCVSINATCEKVHLNCFNYSLLSCCSTNRFAFSYSVFCRFLSFSLIVLLYWFFIIGLFSSLDCLIILDCLQEKKLHVVEQYFPPLFFFLVSILFLFVSN